MVKKYLSNHRTTLLLLFAFTFGVMFRLWFIALDPQPFGWDQYEYEMYAKKMFDNGLIASHSYRSYPYPLFLALVYTFVGFGNHQAVFLVQAILDSLIGVMIFIILRQGFKLRSFAWIGIILYMVNPFTSGYVGVLLAEILSAFFITGTILFGMYFVNKQSAFTGILFGLCAGLAAQTRNAAFLWAALPVGLAMYSLRSRLQSKKILVILLACILTSLYPLYTNFRDYHEINMTTVDSFYAKEFFQGALLKELKPFTYIYPIESHLMWQEYYSEYDQGRTKEERQAMTKKYMDKGWALIQKDPWDYIKLRFYKMWYVWQKENVFFYEESGFVHNKVYTYAINLVLLALALFGPIGYWPLARKNLMGTWVLLSIMATIAYGSFAFSLTHAEYRLTIPFYPLLILAGSLGLVLIVKKCMQRVK